MKKIPMTINMKSLLFLCGLILMSCKNENSSLIGTWNFTADQEIDSVGNIINQDSNVSGLLLYTADGDMSVQLLWHQKREPIMTDSIMKYDGNSTSIGLGNNSWTPDQNRILIDSYDAYFGKYTVDWDNNIVTHRINGNLRPEKKLKEYKRKFTLKGDTLLLRSPDPKDRWQVLWTRRNN